jgi:hypothetical protein
VAPTIVSTLVRCREEAKGCAGELTVSECRPIELEKLRDRELMANH